MNKILYGLIALTVLLSCYDLKKQNNPIKKEGKLYIFHPGMDKPRVKEYELTVSDNDTVIKYSYIYKQKKTGLEFSYNKISKKLTFINDDFTFSEKEKYINESLHKSPFDNYQLKINDVTGTILFNLDYGALDLKTGIGNSYGPHYIFISNNNFRLSKEVISALNK